MTKETPINWFWDCVSPTYIQQFSVSAMLYTGKSKFQSIQVLDTPSFGRCLILDGKIQCSESDEFIYHEALVHPAMIAHPKPETVFIAGGGEGACTRSRKHENHQGLPAPSVSCEPPRQRRHSKEEEHPE